MNRGIFGGTFNPLHNKHCEIIEAFLSNYSDSVLHIIPCSLSPFKTNEHGIEDIHRLMMLRQTFAGRNNIIIDDREIRKGGVSYSIDTVNELRLSYPHDKLFLIIGGDQAKRFGEWKDYKLISESVTILVAERPSYGGVEALTALLKNNRVRQLTTTTSDLSSTYIRDCIVQGTPISNYVPIQVSRYITDNNLYKP